jgi:hypothetical protein
MVYVAPADRVEAIAHSVIFLFEAAAAWALQPGPQSDLITKAAATVRDCAGLLDVQLATLRHAPRCARMARDAYEALADPQVVDEGDIAFAVASCRRAHALLCRETGLSRSFDRVVPVDG